MEVEVIKDRYNYIYCACTKCGSELKIKKSEIPYYYHKGYEIASIICPCCNKEFMFNKP